MRIPGEMLAEFEDICQRFASKDALFTKDGISITYGELYKLISEYAEKLMSQVENSSKVIVALVIPNSIEFVIAFLAILKAGMVVAPLNPIYTKDELVFYLDDLEATALITNVPSVTQVSLERNLITLTPNFDATLPIPTLISRSTMNLEEATSLLLHTSGTTSRPKLVPITLDALSHTVHHLISAYELTEADRIVIAMPLFHVHGLIGCLLTTLFSGGSAMITKFSAHNFLSELIAMKATWFSLVPTMYQILLSNEEYCQGADKAREPLRFMRSCSAALPVNLRQRVYNLFQVPILQAYAMTEATHLLATQTLHDSFEKFDSVGKPLGCTLRIIDPDTGDEYPSGVIGEVCVKGSSVITGYSKPVTANEAAFIDGFFRTGDLGMIDSNGNLTIMGRIKEIINRGGEKINPNEIDRVLCLAPGVQEAVSFAISDPIYGESVACIIVPSNTELDQMELREQIEKYCREHLAPFKCPSVFFYAPTIPKSSIGKVQRAHLTRLYSSNNS